MTEKSDWPLQQVGRVAFRQEGDYWNAYYAKTDTMEGALLLGSIRMVAAMASPKIEQHFMDMMREIVGHLLKEITGTQAQWKEPVAAPEHERTRE